MFKSLAILLILPLSLSLFGCGNDNEKPTAEVRGIVTYNGQRVTGGRLMFDPKGNEQDGLPGKGGSAEIQEDGTFVVGTYENEDGAVIGEHAVSYSAPASQVPRSSTSSGDPTPSGNPVPSPYQGLVPEVPTVTIEKGEKNLLEIKLVMP